MKILVVRFRQIGDALISSVVCNTLKKSFPDAEIDYVLYDFIAPLFENNKNYNIISLSSSEQKNVFKYFLKAFKITRKKYDVVIDLMSTPRSELYSLLSPQAKFRIGWGGEIGKEKKFRGMSYTHKIYETSETLNQTTKFLRILKPLEEAGYKIKYDEDFGLEILDREKKEIRKKMEEAGIDFKKKVFAFAINARKDYKSYPKEKMQKLIELFLEKYHDNQIIFFYSKSEKEFAKNMHKDLNNNPRIFSNIETKSIRELAILLSLCDMFVGNEGGPRHIAHAVGIPTFCFVFGRANWFPIYNENHIVIQPHNLKGYSDELSFQEKYNLMTPEILLEKLSEMLNKKWR